VDKFVARYRSLVTGILSGFDRLVFRGSLPPLLWKYGIQTFLSKVNVRGIELKDYALRTSERVKSAALAEATQAGRATLYLPSSVDSKEQHVSVARSASCARTASSRRSPKRTATSSPPRATRSRPPSPRHAPPRSSNCCGRRRRIRASLANCTT
jgi:hypothetical protein